MNYLIKDDLTLSFYQYDYIEKAFIKFIIDWCQKYPFKFHFLMKKVFNSSEITYIKDTTMIINLNYFSLDKQQYIFCFVREMLEAKVVKKVISKKEFLIIHLYSYKIGEFFIHPSRWLSYIFYDSFRSLYHSEKCLLGVLISNQNQQSDYVDLYLERLGIPFVVYCEKPESSLVIKNNLKKLYLYTPNCRFFDDNTTKEANDCLEFRYNIEKFKNSIKKYFDNPCNLTRFIV
ncbi:MAG: hypothetical protein ACOX40_07350 [Bacilli bacterium]|jgi:hypothetical protein|nr:hypothetical protein [Acholeplasmataceae bacterium]